MPIEIRRFGVGHRRPQGPDGTIGVSGQPIHTDRRGVIAELAIAHGGRIAAQSSPNTTWFVVIEGGGWVVVGDERQRVAAGDAVLWPALVPHAAFTEQTPMRAIVVEFSGSDEADDGAVLEGSARQIGPGDGARVARGDGALAPRDVEPDSFDRASGEPI